jgi:hypothetical protein
MVERCEFHGSNISSDVFVYITHDRHRNSSENKAQTISHFLNFFFITANSKCNKENLKADCSVLFFKD